jgi:hypothetical protein
MVKLPIRGGDLAIRMPGGLHCDRVLKTFMDFLISGLLHDEAAYGHCLASIGLTIAKNSRAINNEIQYYPLFTYIDRN